MTRLAVVVTTYNRPDALERVLSAYLSQEDRDIELLVADDGSTDDTRGVVERFAERTAFPVRHVWHEDRGFRAGAIRNRAIAATDADYIVFTDGDCVPLPGFVASHRALAEPGWFVAGNRMLLSERLTREVLQRAIPLETWSGFDWSRAFLRRDVNRLAPLWKRDIADARGWRRRQPERWEGAKTCNLGVWRGDLLQVNGFDEAYSGWGLEDSDLVIRLLHAGVRHKNGRFGTPLAHLWHAENDRSRLAGNRRQLDMLIASKRTRASTGLDAYLS
ncbi:MAG: glycosyltransferase family 2 protein [bacterium]|jgi:glycosyltransferase involved in cell wall biosynthesis|nr:glycosyltransferase family 2 protein [Betaproteobacteria bacterium]